MIKLNIIIYIYLFLHNYYTAIGVSYFSGDKTDFRNKNGVGGKGEGRPNLAYYY